MAKYFATTIQLKLDPFLAQDEVHASALVDEYLDLVTAFANSLGESRITWEECDTTPITEVDCPTCKGRGEVIVFDGNTGLPFEITCPDCEDN
jgi:hypothetical protein